MNTNNIFEIHGINHLSASQINCWASDPALYVMNYLFKTTSHAGPSAWRGIATEYALHLKTTRDDLTDEAITQLLYTKFDDCHYESKSTEYDKIEKERKTIENYYKSGLELYSILGKPKQYQQKIVKNFDDFEVPFVGYIDFIYEEDGKGINRDTKTTARIPSKLTYSTSRQLSIYLQAFNGYECWVDYISPKEVKSYKLTNVEAHMKSVFAIAHGIRKFLSISNDKEELASLLYPNFDSWMWTDEMKQQAKKIWRE